jgi:small subunit ribosomal protein S13
MDKTQIPKPTKAPAPVTQAPVAADAPKVKYIVRIANTDLDGLKCAIIALQKIKGVGHTFANTTCMIAGVNRDAKMGSLQETQWRKMEEIIVNPIKFMPTWMLNRQLDYETGENKHLISGDLTYQIDNDIKRLKMIKTRRGLRHAWGLPLRGQKTRSQHRKTKSKKSASSKRRPHKSTTAGASASSSGPK